MKEYLRQIPAINKLIDSAACNTLIEQYGLEMVTDHVRRAVDQTRQVILAGEANGTPPSAASIIALAENSLKKSLAPSLPQ